MRKTLPLFVFLLFAGMHSQAQSPAMLATADFGAQPDPAIPAVPAQFGIGGPQGPGAPVAGPTPFGNGEQPVLRFAGDNGPQNQFSFNLSDDTGYDDNVFGTDYFRKRDFYTSVGPRVTFVTARKRVTFDFDYVPFFRIFKRYSGYDSMNQTLTLDAAAKISSRFQLRVRESGAELYYGLFGGNGEQVLSGLGPPGGTVPYFVNPDSRNIISTSRIDIIFNKSARTSIDVFGGFTTLNVKNLGTTGTYADLQSPSGGLSYSYRLSPRGSFSSTYFYSNSLYSRTQFPIRYQAQSISLSYAYQISKTLSVSFFGGPEYTRLRETLVIPYRPSGFIVLPLNKPEWDWSAGFSASRTTASTTISLSGSRYVSAGGGLVTAVNDTSGALNISRRLPRGWTGNTGLTYAQLRSLSFGGLMSGNYNLAYGTLGFQHKLGERATARLDYRGTRQRAGLGNTLAYANVDRNLASVGIEWQIGKVHLGH
jgi:hypothetical protein